MDVAIISAMSALFGSSIGALSSFSTIWLVQTSQLRSQHRGNERTKRERLYADFIAEAAKRMTDALSHQSETPEVLVLLVASIPQPEGAARRSDGRRKARPTRTFCRRLPQGTQ